MCVWLRDARSVLDALPCRPVLGSPATGEKLILEGHNRPAPAHLRRSETELFFLLVRRVVLPNTRANMGQTPHFRGGAFPRTLR